MVRRHLNLSLAFVASLCVHAWAIHALFVRADTASALSASRARPAKVQDRKVLQPLEVVKLPPRPRKPLPSELEEQFGQSEGRGTAINSMQGEKPLVGKQSKLEQAILTRKPGEHRPTDIVRPNFANAVKSSGNKSGGNNGAAEKMLAALMPHDAAAPPILGLPDSPNPTPPHAAPRPAPGPSKKNTPNLELRTRNSELKNPPQQSKPTPARPSAPPQPSRLALVPAGTGGGEAAGRAGNSQPTPAGDPGEKSESESDPFTHVGAAVFQAGRLDARFGRKVKTVRPDFTLGGRIDLSNMVDPTVQLEVHTDAAGKPTEVEVLQSSGSPSVDEPVRLAVYQWWFEPPKNRKGQPIPDVMVWTISFH